MSVEHNTRHGVAGAHGIHRWIHADQAARFAEPVVSGDRGKVSWQQSDNTFWILKDHTLAANANGWTSAIGSQGDPGDDGAPGATGPAGPTGATGSQGVPGSGVLAVYNWGAVAAPANVGARYMQRPAGAVSATFTSGEYAVPSAAAGSRTVTVNWSVTTALVTDSIVITVMINGVATALTATMAAGALFGSASATITIAAGDRIVPRMVQSSTEANATTWNGAICITIG